VAIDLLPSDGGAAPRANTALLRVENLHKTYGTQHALQGINLSVAAGEVVAIIGPSGSGKSTLLRCINQLEPPTLGRVTVGDVTVDAGIPAPKAVLHRLRRSVGMVFQSFNLFPHLTALRNVCLAQERVLGLNRGQAEAIAMQLLAKVGLADKAYEYPTRCSGGQQQRIAIARALALNPAIILFDEPTSALDPELGLEVLSVMRGLADAGMTMVVVTHEMRFAEKVSDRVLIMAQGSIIEEGPSSVVMSDPRSARGIQFLSAVKDR